MFGRGLDRQRRLPEVSHVCLPLTDRLLWSRWVDRLSAAASSSSSPSSPPPHAAVSSTTTPSSSFSQPPTASKLLERFPPTSSSHYQPLYFSLSTALPLWPHYCFFSPVTRSGFLADLGFFFFSRFTDLVLFFKFPCRCLLFLKWVKSK